LPWRRHYFKGKQKVWLEIDEQGDFVKDDKGLVPMRYKVEDADRTYSASTRSIGDPVEDTEPVDGESSEKAASTQASSSTKKSTSAPAPDDAGACLVSTQTPDELLSEPPPPEGVIEVYTDGACQGNPGPCSYGVVIRYGPHYKEISQYLGHGTNNIAELTAIKVALESFKRRDLPVRLHTDSSYSIGAITQGWKTKANKELILGLRDLAQSFEDLEFIKVKGHAGIPLNERADSIAVAAIEATKS